MRLAPIPMAYRENTERAIHYAGESSRTTHGAPAAVDACRYYAALIVGALKGWAKEDLLRPDFYQGSLVPEIAEIAAGSFKRARSTNTRLMAAGYSTGFGRSVSSQPSCRRELGNPIDREVGQPR